MSFFQSSGQPLIPPRDDMTVPQFMLDIHNAHPTRPKRVSNVPCLIEESTGRKVYLDELDARSDALSIGLRMHWGIKDADVVSILSPNHLDYAVCIWATHKLGGTIATHNPALTVEELVYQLQVAKPVLLIVHVSGLAVAKQATELVDMPAENLLVIGDDDAPVPSPFEGLDDTISEGLTHSKLSVERKLSPGQARKQVAFLCFSSGTTGKPKAVAISHYNVITNIVQIATWHHLNQNVPQEEQRYGPGEVCSNVLPMYHIYGLVVNLHFIIYAGMSLVVSQKFNFEVMLQSIVKYRISHLLIVPPQVVLFCKHPAVKQFDLSHVRYCVMAAAPISAELTNQFLGVMPQVHLGQGYGMTETCAAVSMFPMSQRVGTPGSGGQLVPGTVAKVVKRDGSLAGPDEAGELWAKGDQMALGYYKNPEATRETFTDGWVRTGDEVIIKANGDLFVVDRLKEIFKVKGFQVAPAELEGHLLDHPDVADAGVIGIPDEYAGEVPMAFIMLRPEAATRVARDPESAVHIKTSIKKHVSTVKSQYKWLAGGVEFIDAIPKNPSGKILRRILREKAQLLRTPARARL